MGDGANRYRTKIITIPNLMSFFRLCLIPIIVWCYVARKDNPAALIVLALSGVTDVVDGIIARRFGMVSDFGKILDPIADKLTQAAMLCCLVSRFPYMLFPLILLGVKEICTAVTGLISIRKTGRVKGAAWHGKLTTVALYSMMALHLIWYDMPQAVSLITVCVCIGSMILSFILYTVQNITAIRNKNP